jgi:hypothetical protein
MMSMLWELMSLTEQPFWPYCPQFALQVGKASQPTLCFVLQLDSRIRGISKQLAWETFPGWMIGKESCIRPARHRLPSFSEKRHLE